MKDTKSILKQIVDHYFESRDFNGIALSQLFSINLDPDGEDKALQKAKYILKELIQKRCIDLNFEKCSGGDAHIIRLELCNPKNQLEHLEQLTASDRDLGRCCAYPSKKYIKEKVDITKYKRYKEYKDKPFTLLLAQGEPQLSHRAFDLRVLEFYSNDPRYTYRISGSSGEIFVKDEDKLNEKDNTYLKQFGIALDKNLNRYVAVYLRYLSRLTPEHQTRWSSDMYEGATSLHPDYWKPTLAGKPPEKISVFSAFRMELEVINEMTNLITGKLLFKNTEKKGKNFDFLIRPTKKEYGEFVQSLDKMISDNINKDFFQSIINSDEDNQKGTLTLLSEWIDQEMKLYIHNIDIQTMIKTFKKVRSERSKSSHNIRDDEWDDQCFKKQIDLINDVYTRISDLRKIFANHPKTQEVKISDYLLKGQICDY